MLRIFCILIILIISFFNTSCTPVVTRPIPINDLDQYDNYQSNVRKVIAGATVLSKQHLRYKFGSANPKTGGLDCSGVIYYLLRSINRTYIPRSSYDLYIWLLKAGKIHHVTTHYFHSPEFAALKPGDLLFWTGTYRTHRKPPITHVMLYLGKNKHHQPLMFGSSNGGIYHGTRIWGVSVFDFILPRKSDRFHFVAYGCIPSFTC